MLPNWIPNGCGATDFGTTFFWGWVVRCTAVYGTPTMFVDMVAEVERQPRDLGSVSTAVLAGAPCPQPLAHAVVQRLNAKHLNVRRSIFAFT